VLVAPHGLRAAALARPRAAAALAAAPRPLAVLATTATYALPWWLGGTVNLGLESAAALCRTIGADVFLPSHGEAKASTGCVPRFAAARYASAAEVAAAIPCARPRPRGGPPDAPAPPAPRGAPPRPAREVPPAAADAEAPATAEALRALAARAPRVDARADCVRVERAWDAAARTHTYHTHVFVSGVGDGARARALLERCAHLFLHAYMLERHGWYAAFVRGRATACAPGAGGAPAACGWGVFELGLGRPRAFHTRFLRVDAGADAAAVVLRSVVAEEAPPGDVVKMFLLPPTGDLFRLADGGLHWHHVCTVRGVRLLPGALDGALMTALRATGADGAERGTYEREGWGFVRFVKGEWDAGVGEGAAVRDVEKA